MHAEPHPVYCLRCGELVGEQDALYAFENPNAAQDARQQDMRASCACQGSLYNSPFSVPIIKGGSMTRMTRTALRKALSAHEKWLEQMYIEPTKATKGTQLILYQVDLSGVDFSNTRLDYVSFDGCLLSEAIFKDTSMCKVFINDSCLFRASFINTCLSSSRMKDSTFYKASFIKVNMQLASAWRVDYSSASFEHTIMQNALFEEVCFTTARFCNTALEGTRFLNCYMQDTLFNDSDLSKTGGLVKPMGVMPGNCYWKRFEEGLKNRDFQFYVGLNRLPEDEEFNQDESKTCTYPGLHFASRRWCAERFPNRPLEALVRIPEGAKINEPWVTDGKASADMIEILQVFNVQTGEDVTDQYRRK